MENKYYTPAIEDLRVGYECECLWVRPEPKTWDKIEVTETDTEEYLKLSVQEVIRRVKTGEIRTPYLTKEQIEAEGWVFKTTNRIRSWYEKPDLFIDAPHSPSHQILAAELIHDSEYNTIQIRVQLRSDFEYHTFYEGNCPSINEFRTITKLLGI